MKKILLLVFVTLFLPTHIIAQDVTNYIIQNDIGGYKSRPKPTKRIFGNSGIVIPVGHFDDDHDDISYVTRYIKPEPILGVSVEVTQHAGVDSDKWLLHEIEDNYRDPDDEDGRLGLPLQATRLREISGNKIIGRRGNGYTWVSNNHIVIDVSYTDLKGDKPEPLEVVQAYLIKFPSKISTTSAEFKSQTYNVKWIKDEMERRLWLCDKWSMQLQLGKTTQKDMLEALVKHIRVFLNYRQKYYGVKAADEIALLSTALQANDGTTIKNKLAEYKIWWNVNKGKSISI